MAETNNNNNEELLNMIGDMSFLPKEAKDENLGRSFLKLSKNEKLFRLIFLSALGASFIAYLVCLFYFGSQGYYFLTSVKGSYGPLGLIVTAIFTVVFFLAIAFGHFYDCKWADDEEKREKLKPYSAVLLYVSFLLLYATFMTTVLRSFVFQKNFSSYGWFLRNLGWITYALIAIVGILGIVLNFLKPKKAKIYNYCVLALAGWIVIFFTALLQKSYSMSSRYGIMLFIFGAIFMDLSLIPLLLQKKNHGMRSAFYVILSIGVIFDLLSIVIYGLI